MKSRTLAALVTTLVLAAGIGGYLAGHRPSQLDRPPAGAIATPAPAANPQARPQDPRPGPHVAQAPSDPRVAQAPTQPAGAQPRAPQRIPFGFQRVAIDGSRLQVEACLQFNEPLDDSGRTKYADFISIEPDAKPAIRVQAERLCLGGLAHGVDYKVELKAGFPARGPVRLAVAETVDVALGERTPFVSFASGGGFILPRQGAAGVAISTVNVEKVRVEVFRVTERLLPRVGRSRYYDDDVGNAQRMQWYEISQFLRDTGARIWTGTMDVQGQRNQSITTSFPVRETIRDWKPGAYVVLAWDARRGSLEEIEREDYDTRYDFEAAVQWLVDTDLGLTTFTGADGLTVFARSLQSAKAMPGVELVLLARNNEELARATTDANGRAAFAAGLLRGSGASTPTSVQAFDRQRNDFNHLSLNKSAFDFSDRGVEGRASPGPVDGYLYTDRGIYRPGETVHVVAMIRDHAGVALDRPSVTLVTRRPDGAEFRRVTATAEFAGSTHYVLELSKNARRGKWSVDAYLDPKGSPVGRVEFQVDDFIPQKLKVELTGMPELLTPGQNLAVNVAADFLYGAPAGGLEGEGEMRVEADSRPFPAFAGYRFGLSEEKFEPESIKLEVPATNEQGKTRATGAVKLPKETSLPLVGTVDIAIMEPGGRATRNSANVRIRTQDLYIGLKPQFTEAFAAEDRDVAIDVIAVNAQGRRVAKQRLKYQLLRESSRFVWTQEDRGWRWRYVTTDRPIAEGTLDVGIDRPTVWQRPLVWGSYRLAVVDEASGAQSSLRFYVGWYANAATETPDQASVVADKASYIAGETAKLRIKAPFAGEALVVLAGDRVFETRSVSVAAEGSTIEVPVSADWGPGAYALVTAYRPLGDRHERAPVRAVGVAWLGVDPAARSLPITVSAPEKSLPRRRLDVPLRIANAAGSEVFLTLAAVDEGVLQLTKFRTPAPLEHYFGKRRLGLAMRDDYGKLLDPTADALGRIREGGDAAAGAGLEVVPIKTAALFSGVVRLDANGEARIPLEIPDFIGQLRLMVVAFDKQRVGSADARVFVRDPVATDLVLPRFLAPGDQSTASVSLHNVEGAAGAYRVRLSALGSVDVGGDATRSVELPVGKRELITFPIRATDAAISRLTLAVEGPGGFSVSRDWEIQVRPAQAPTTVQTVTPLEPGKELTLDRDLLASFVSGTANVSVAVSTLRGIDVAALLQSLDRYPYGCLEQTTSRALPLLYFSDAAALGGAKDDRGVPIRVQEAIYRVLDMQAADGGFGMWGPYASSADLWLQTYTIDFLMRARERGFAVPEAQLRRALQWLGRVAVQANEDTVPDTQAYALYVLARAGLIDAGRVRYFQDTRAEKIVWSVGQAHLAGALSLIGEKGRAAVAFAAAQQATRTTNTRHSYYGSDQRDLMVLVAVAAETGERRLALDIANERFPRIDWKVSNLTTQEKAWVLIAATSLLQGGQLSLQAGGQAVSVPRQPAVLNPDSAALTRGYVVRNNGTQPVYAAVSTRGVPTTPLPAETKGIEITRTFHKPDGSDVNLGQVRQNDRLIVLLSGKATDQNDYSYRELAILDLLPAGFEIEAPLEQENVYRWLPKLDETTIVQARDDRYFATVHLGEPYDPFGRWGRVRRDGSYPNGFKLAYVVRAVTPGSYVVPAFQVEDMYRPAYLARTAPGRTTILPR
jgi:uncharacterized protein YfaS (alpha-2-macroglobulin family)